MVTSYIPDRGDIVWIDFSPSLGHEQGGRRPAIVVSSKTYNKPSKLMVVCPITTKTKNYPFEVPVKTGRIDGVVLVDQIRNLSWASRPVRYETKASVNLIQKIQDLVVVLARG